MMQIKFKIEGSHVVDDIGSITPHHVVQVSFASEGSHAVDHVASIMYLPVLLTASFDASQVIERGFTCGG